MLRVKNALRVTSLVARTIPDAILGQAFELDPPTFTSEGGEAGADIVFLTLKPLPVGLVLDSETGAISGTPKLTGNRTFTILITDGTEANIVELETITIQVKREDCDRPANGRLLFWMQ